jgi:oligogalacturonide transporter
MSNPVAIKLKTYIGYGMTDLFSSGAFAIIAAWLMYFYQLFWFNPDSGGFDFIYCEDN